MSTKSQRTASFAFVIGARNELTQLRPLFTRLQQGLSAFPGSHIVLVENGSTDGTLQAARAIARHLGNDAVPIEVRHSEPGLGNAVRCGIGGLSAEFAVITAADLPFGLSDLDAFVRSGLPNLATGSKNHPASDWPESDRRRIVMSHGFALARSILFGLGGLDTQGSVFVRTELLDRVAGSLVSQRYFISTEILLRVQALGEQITYLPVSAPASQAPRASHVTMGSGVGVLWEMLRVRATLRGRQPDAGGGTRKTA